MDDRFEEMVMKAAETGRFSAGALSDTTVRARARDFLTAAGVPALLAEVEEMRALVTMTLTLDEAREGSPENVDAEIALELSGEFASQFLWADDDYTDAAAIALDYLLAHPKDIGSLWTAEQLREALDAAVETGTLARRDLDLRWPDGWNNVPVYWLTSKEGSDGCPHCQRRDHLTCPRGIDCHEGPCCDWETEPDGTCPVDPCQCRPNA